MQWNPAVKVPAMNKLTYNALDANLTTNDILRVMHSQFSLPPELVSGPNSPVTNYHILHWSGQYLREQNHHGHIRKDGQVWKIIFHHHSASACYNAPQCKLSFRRYKGHCIVLIVPHNLTLTEISAIEYAAATRGE